MGNLTKTLTALSLVFLIISTTSQAQVMDLQLYKACLMECFKCVQTYGKSFYNGKICADNCAETSGKSIDAKCVPPEKRTGRPPSLSSSCAKLCEMNCSYDSQKHKVDAHFCVLSCILSNQKYTKC